MYIFQSYIKKSILTVNNCLNNFSLTFYVLSLQETKKTVVFLSIKSKKIGLLWRTVTRYFTKINDDPVQSTKK